MECLDMCYVDVTVSDTDDYKQKPIGCDLGDSCL